MLSLFFCGLILSRANAILDIVQPPTPQAVKALNNSVNVRTVLFRDSDTCKLCWSKEDLNLLIARRLVQDLIPRKVPRDFPALYTYLKGVVNIVKCKTQEKNLHTMLLATYDALGGYLHSIAIPILNEAFYAGNVDFATTSNLHTMLGVMMEYLGTNGNPWAPPVDMRKIPTKVAALPIRMCKLEEACNAFVITRQMYNHTVDCGIGGVPTPETKIQIPFLDDNAYPSAIAVPLKDHPLFSLMSECAVNIVPKYYILAMRCLSSSSFNNKDIISFNRHLHRWIIATVVPHLHEMERWYPGFGGIMRVVETMNQRGLASTEVIKPDIRNENLTLDLCVDVPKTCPSSSHFGWLSGLGCIGWKKILMWIAIILLLLLLLLLIICCIRCCISCIRGRQSGDVEAKDRFTNTLVNLYCGIKGRQEGDMNYHQNECCKKFASSAGSYEGVEEESEEDYDTE